MATVWSRDWPDSYSESGAKAQMSKYLDAFARHNFTGIFFQVRGFADALYTSSHEPWSAILTGTRGKNPGWDPLEWLVAECHARGLECYAWVKPYLISISSAPFTTAYDRQWQNDGWVLTNGTYTVFNPGHPDANAHTLEVIKEIYNNYDVDGMVFDDFFYPNGGISEGVDAPDYDLYLNSGTSLSIGDWRRENVNRFMKLVCDNIQADRPDMRFGISPAGVSYKSASKYGLAKPLVSALDWQYDEIYSDPLAWLANGSVDFIAPQIYWKTNHPTAPFGPLTRWWASTADHFGRHFYASHSITMLADDNSVGNWVDIAAQVALHRESCGESTLGGIYFSSKDFDGIGKDGVSGLGDYLQENVYQSKSLVPVVSWKSRPVYPAPVALSVSESVLSWDAAIGSGFRPILRYTVYAIPSEVSVDEAMAPDGDGIEEGYLLGVTYSNSYIVPSRYQNGYYFAVCVYDGYGYESAPAIIGYDPSSVNSMPFHESIPVMTVVGSEVTFDSPQPSVSVYTAVGTLVARVGDVLSLTLPGCGAYVIVVGSRAYKVIVC